MFTKSNTNYIMSLASSCSSISTSASLSAYRLSLKKVKYHKDKEITKLQKRILELKKEKEAYRKKVERLQKSDVTKQYKKTKHQRCFPCFHQPCFQVNEFLASIK